MLSGGAWYVCWTLGRAAHYSILLYTPICVRGQNLPLILSLLSSTTDRLYRLKILCFFCLSPSGLPFSSAASIKKEWGVSLSEHLDHFNSCFVQSSLLIFTSQSNNSPEIYLFFKSISFPLIFCFFPISLWALMPLPVELNTPGHVLFCSPWLPLFSPSLSCQGSSSKSNAWSVQQSTSSRRKLSPN